jgi:hypothetical protein
MRHRNRHAWEVWRDTLLRGLSTLGQTVGCLILAVLGFLIVPATAELIRLVASLFGIHLHLYPGG